MITDYGQQQLNDYTFSKRLEGSHTDSPIIPPPLLSNLPGGVICNTGAGGLSLPTFSLSSSVIGRGCIIPFCLVFFVAFLVRDSKMGSEGTNLQTKRQLFDKILKSFET